MVSELIEIHWERSRPDGEVYFETEFYPVDKVCKDKFGGHNFHITLIDKSSGLGLPMQCTRCGLSGKIILQSALKFSPTNILTL